MSNNLGKNHRFDGPTHHKWYLFKIIQMGIFSVTRNHLPSTCFPSFQTEIEFESVQRVKSFVFLCFLAGGIGKQTKETKTNLYLYYIPPSLPIHTHTRSLYIYINTPYG